MVELMHLRLVQGVLRGLEIGAGIAHRLIQPQGKEIVAKVVVVLDVALLLKLFGHAAHHPGHGADRHIAAQRLAVVFQQYQNILKTALEVEDLVHIRLAQRQHRVIGGKNRRRLSEDYCNRRGLVPVAHLFAIPIYDFGAAVLYPREVSIKQSLLHKKSLQKKSSDNSKSFAIAILIITPHAKYVKRSARL